MYLDINILMVFRRVKLSSPEDPLQLNSDFKSCYNTHEIGRAHGILATLQGQTSRYTDILRSINSCIDYVQVDKVANGNIRNFWFNSLYADANSENLSFEELSFSIDRPFRFSRPVGRLFRSNSARPQTATVSHLEVTNKLCLLCVIL